MKREINLITEEFIFDPLEKIKPKLVAGWLICLIAVLGWLIGSKEIEIKKAQADLVQMNTHLTQLSKEEQDLIDFIQKNGKSETETFFQESIHWIEILSTIGSIVPEGAWLKNLEGGIKKEGKDQPAVKQIKMSGFATSYTPITLMLSRLERQPLFSQIHLIDTQKGESPEDHYVHFEITGKLN